MNIKIYTLCTFFLCTKENCRKMTIQRLLITIIKTIKKLIKKKLMIQNFIHRFKKIDYLQIQEYEILKYIPYVHSSCVRKRIVVK